MNVFYNSEKAKYHIKKAGLEGHTFELHASRLGQFMDVAILFKEQAAKAGINIKVTQHPADGYWSNVWLKKPFCMCWWGGRPTADMQLSTAYMGDAPWNDTHFRHKHFDGLLLAARAELDSGKRAKMYADCQQILRDEGGAVVPFFKDYVDAAGEKVRFGKIAANWECDGHHASERWWFA